VFVPAYNEDMYLPGTVKKIEKVLNQFTKSFEIVIIDDASTDLTNKIGTSLTTNEKNIKYVRFENGPSKRENLAASFTKSNGEIIAFADSDILVSLGYMPALYHEVRRGADIAIGSRYVKGSKINRRLSRLLVSKIYNNFLRLYFGSSVRDHQCGLKIFRKDVILDLIKNMKYVENQKRGWFWDAELLIRAQKNGLKISELPIEWECVRKRPFGLRNQLKIIPYMLRLKREI